MTFLRVRFFVALLAFVTASTLASNSAWADEDDADFVWATEPDVRVDIEIISGRIEIQGWDRNEVRLEVDDGDAHALDIKARRKRVSIRSPGVRRRRPLWGEPGDFDVKVYVPMESRVEAKTVNGEIRAEGVDGTLDFHAANGQIEVRGGPTDSKLETLNSSIKFEGPGTRVDARTINGSIDLRGVSGDVTASTMSGSIRVEGESFDRVELKTLSGSIELAGRLASRARAHLKSFSGSIKLGLPSDTSARFDLQTFSGSLRNELTTGSTLTDRRRGGQHLEFVTAEGDGRVTVENFSGGVEIRVDD